MSSTLISETVCPLCGSGNLELLIPQFKARKFQICSGCNLISVTSQTVLTVEDEKLRYQQHINTEQNVGYVTFLYQLVNPMLSLFSRGMTGLDYGCGPTIVLANIFGNLGYDCDAYDPLFFPELPSKKYDFITATECFEHFNDAYHTIEHIISLLKPNGYLGIMTVTWNNLETFGKWHYIRDLTHVSFYHIDTIHWISIEFNLLLVYSDCMRVFVFKKN